MHLIEVNTNPCLETESPLLTRIINELLENTFKIVLDPLFPTPDLTSVKKVQVNEIPNQLKYTLIFDEDIDGPQLIKGQESEEDIESDCEGALDLEEE